MSESRPHLALVSEGEEAAERAGEAPAVGRSGGSRLAWLLAGALLVCAVGWMLSAQRASELATTLDATTTALVEARGQLEAYDGHLDQVRERTDGVLERVGSLAAELESLSGFLEAGPLAAPAEAALPAD